jgi:hypothetical protein
MPAPWPIEIPDLRNVVEFSKRAGTAWATLFIGAPGWETERVHVFCPVCFDKHQTCFVIECCSLLGNSVFVAVATKLPMVMTSVGPPAIPHGFERPEQHQEYLVQAAPTFATTLTKFDLAKDCAQNANSCQQAVEIETYGTIGSCKWDSVHVYNHRVHCVWGVLLHNGVVIVTRR